MPSSKKEYDSFYAQAGARIILAASLYITFGAVVYHVLEKFTWIDAFYFVVITLATVGYGDIVPKTNLGKLFTIFFVIAGIAIFSALIADIAKRAREKREKRFRE